MDNKECIIEKTESLVSAKGEYFVCCGSCWTCSEVFSRRTVFLCNSHLTLHPVTSPRNLYMLVCTLELLADKIPQNIEGDRDWS